MRYRPRPGLATVEFVMVLPVMMLLTAIIIKSAEVSIAKTRANIEAREKVYQAGRGSEPAPIPNRELFASVLGVNRGSYGLAVSSGERSVSLRPVLDKASTHRGRVALLLGTWDHNGLKFPTRSTHNPISEQAIRAALVPAGVYKAAAATGGVPPSSTAPDTSKFDLGSIFGNQSPSDGVQLLKNELMKVLEEEGKKQLLGKAGEYYNILKGFPENVLGVAKELLEIAKNPKKITEHMDAIKDAKQTWKDINVTFDKVKQLGDRKRLNGDF